MDAKKVQIFDDSPDLKKIPAKATLKWRYNVFQRFQQVTYEQTFLKLSALTKDRVFFCVAGWDGVRFDIVNGSNRNFTVHFTLQDLNAIELEDDDVLVAQHKYIARLSIMKADTKSAVI